MLTSYLLSSSLASVASNPVPFSAIIAQENNLLQRKLDPIQAQMLKTNDPVLEVVHRIEDGTVKRFWEEQAKIPSTTWLGDLVDRIFGWGRFHESNQPAKTTDNATQVPEKLKEECATPYMWIKFFAKATFPTSVEAEMNENNTCIYKDPDDYEARIYLDRNRTRIPNSNVIPWREAYLDPDRCLFLSKCIYDAVKACERDFNCFPCEKPLEDDLLKAAQEVSRNKDKLSFFGSYVLNDFNSKTLKNLTWHVDAYGNGKSSGDAHIWKALQIFKVMEKIIQTCEIEEAHHNELIMLNNEFENQHTSLRNKFEIAAVISLVVGSILGYSGKRYLDYFQKLKELKS